MYEEAVNHIHRTAIIVVVDCSTSMKKYTLLNKMPIVKAEAAALITNLLIDELYERARRYDEVRNYYDIAVIGFSGDGVSSKLPGDGDFVAINRLADLEPQPRTYYIDQVRPDGTCVKAPFVLHPWVEAEAHGTSPLFDALIHVKGLLTKWCSRRENFNSLPPIVFNITDGDCYDADAWSLTDIAHDIASTSTYDGNTLLINIVLQTMGEDDYNTKIFPSDATYYSTNRNRTILLRMSSLFPEGLSAKIKKMFHLEHDGPYRGIAYNTVVTELLNIINIGSENAV